MAYPVSPGPCPDSGCPAPTEIDCIQVNRVYDFCFQTLTRDPLCFDIPQNCGQIPSGSTATGTVSSVTCTTQQISEIEGSGGFANALLLVTVVVSFTITNPLGVVVCTFSGEFFSFTSVTLCAPDGVTVNCQVPSTFVSPATIINNDVCAIVTVCLLIESVALVNLLVPSYGFCVPAPCVVSAAPPFSCPPSPLYPPMCPTILPTTTPTTTPEFPIGGPFGSS